MKPDTPIRIAAVLLAGGNSRRMGTHKAGIPFLDSTTGEVLLRKLTSVCDTVYVSGDPGQNAFLGADVIPDLQLQRGPVSGLSTVMQSIDADAVLFCPCDLPLLEAEVFAYLLSEFLVKPRPLGIQTAGQGNPLLAMYPRSVFRTVIAAFETGENRAREIFRLAGGEWLDVSDRFPRWMFLNMNSASDLQRVTLAAAGKAQLIPPGKNAHAMEISLPPWGESLDECCQRFHLPVTGLLLNDQIPATGEKIMPGDRISFAAPEIQ